MTDIPAELRSRVLQLRGSEGWVRATTKVMLAAANDIILLRAMLRSAMCMVHGLGCPGCGAQGRGMAAPGKCCRDAGCDAGFYGIGCDEVKDLLEAADELMPGVLAEIENPASPINLASEA